MITPKITNSRVTLGPVTLCYVHLLEPYAHEQGETPKYSCTILVPKSATETVEAIRKAVDDAKAYGVRERWNGKKATAGKDNPLKDGDEKDDEHFKNCWYINARSNRRPGVIGRNNEPLTTEDEVYSGMIALVSVEFFPYQMGGNGIAAAIANVKKVKDGERFTATGPSAEAELGGIALNEEEDDDI